MKVVILNSTHMKQHFGCKIVTQAFETRLAERDVEIIGRYGKRSKTWDMRVLDKADLVIVNAEGSIHHGKNEHLLRVGFEYPAVLVNGSMQALTEDATVELAEFHFVTVREYMTRNYLAAEFGCMSKVVPDVIFTFAENMEPLDRTLAVGQFVSDSSNKDGPDFAPKIGDKDYLTMLALSETACLGRFHAICAAAIMGIPFTAWPANTWKNESIMADMGNFRNYYLTYDNAVMADIYDNRLQVAEYVEQATKDVDALFDRIANL